LIIVFYYVKVREIYTYGVIKDFRYL
jgi:hypothetical protein